jgi:hypothetical protein
MLALLVVGGAMYAQESAPKPAGITSGGAVSPTPVTFAPTPTPVAATTPARKSYPLPEALSNEIVKLVTERNRSERALLDYISDPKIYSSEDDVIRVAMFDRQQKLFKQFGAALDEAGKWVVAQRKEFKCDNCEAQLVDGKWLFKEPDVATTAQGGAK